VFDFNETPAIRNHFPWSCGYGSFSLEDRKYANMTIWMNVLDWLEPNDVINFRQVCKNFCGITSYDMWKNNPLRVIGREVSESDVNEVISYGIDEDGYKHGVFYRYRPRKGQTIIPRVKKRVKGVMTVKCIYEHGVPKYVHKYHVMNDDLTYANIYREYENGLLTYSETVKHKKYYSEDKYCELYFGLGLHFHVFTRHYTHYTYREFEDTSMTSNKLKNGTESIVEFTKVYNRNWIRKNINVFRFLGCRTDRGIEKVQEMKENTDFTGMFEYDERVLYKCEWVYGNKNGPETSIEEDCESYRLWDMGTICHELLLYKNYETIEFGGETFKISWIENVYNDGVLCKSKMEWGVTIYKSNGEVKKRTRRIYDVQTVLRQLDWVMK
jgi:hypothetical protein